jgi:hypothetical protein
MKKADGRARRRSRTITAAEPPRKHPQPSKKRKAAIRNEIAEESR